MPLIVTWPEITLRLALAAAAGLLIGFDRQAQGQAAGLRTTTLVCLAACIVMILANLMLGMTGADPTRFTRIDVLRLPMGILSGMGFLGAGAILRRGDVVVGVTTAATLWFMTCIGLVIGAGQLALGAAGTGLGWAVLWGLKWIDLRIARNYRGALVVSAQRASLDERQLRRILETSGRRMVSWAVTYEDGAVRYQAEAELEWRGYERDRALDPDFVRSLAENPAVLRAQWAPKGVSG